MKKLLLLVAIVIATTCNIMSQVRFGAPFTDNMVIKQSSEVAIWGTASGYQSITIVASWLPADTVVVKATSHGVWSTTIKTPKADNKAHTIKANGTVLKNVMLGEVWLCSGQSNMAWSASKKIKDGEQHIAEASHPNIRIFQTPLLGSATPQDNVDAKWVTCTPETMSKTSAVGYFFARELHRELDVPVGIIVSAWGGRPAAPFIPIEYLDEELLDNLSTNSQGVLVHQPAVIYNKMIHPVVPYGLSGAIWYQGESNRLKAAYYDKMMRTLIESWRDKFQNENLPFYAVQIAPNDYKSNDTFAAEIREAQEKTSLLHHSGMVVISDLVDNVKNIHPTDKLSVGIRLSKFALSEVYGFDIKEYKSPTLSKVTFDKKKAVVELKDLHSKLSCSAKRINGFTIAGDDNQFVEAEAKIVGNKIEVWSSAVKSPVKVRYCFDDTTIGNLFTEAGLPVAPFRSDRDF